MASCCIKCCRSVRHFPTRLICILVLILQGCATDYYLAHYIHLYWTAFAIADFIVIILFIVTFYVSYRHLKRHKQTPKISPESEEESLPLGFISWFFYTVVLSVKVGFSFKRFSHELEEETFFGENTLKTTYALAGIVFFLLLSTNHDAKPGSDRRRYIEELTGTVIFDILDGVDSLDILFEKDAREKFIPGLEDTIIVIACLNFVLPTIPLATLAKSKFGKSKLPQRLVILHKVCLAFLVNLPLLITRMILWHGLGNGISIFSLKNIIIIGTVSYDLYEHYEGQEATVQPSAGKEHPKELNKSDTEESWEVQSYTLENRYNYHV